MKLYGQMSSKQDVYNLVSAIIVRMNRNFDANDVIRIADKYMQGNMVGMSRLSFMLMVDDILNVFTEYGIVSFDGKSYKTQKKENWKIHFNEYPDVDLDLE